MRRLGDTPSGHPASAGGGSKLRKPFHSQVGSDLGYVQHPIVRCTVRAARCKAPTMPGGQQACAPIIASKLLWFNVLNQLLLRHSLQAPKSS